MFGLFKNRRKRGRGDVPAEGDDRIRPGKNATSEGDTDILPLIGEDGTVKAGNAPAAQPAPSTGDTGRIPTIDATERFRAAVSDIAQVRYQVEHALLPQLFHESPRELLDLLEIEGGLCGLYRQTFASAGVAFPYTPMDFNVTGMSLGDDYRILSLFPPAPENPPLCHRIHLVYDASYGRLGYYTIERGQSGGYLCFWDKDGVHHNMNHIETPGNTDALFLAMEAVVIGKLHEERFKSSR